jgi:hypothetical protein
MEGLCVRHHANYITNYGWAYCPWCGLELAYKAHCYHCNKDFVSERAYAAHRIDVELYIDNPCPNQRPTTERHNTRYHKNRGKMYCQECRLEYPVRAEATDDRPVDSRPRRQATVRKDERTER